jgi:hypothetical protein
MQDSRVSETAGGDPTVRGSVGSFYMSLEMEELRRLFPTPLKLEEYLKTHTFNFRRASLHKHLVHEWLRRYPDRSLHWFCEKNANLVEISKGLENVRLPYGLAHWAYLHRKSRNRETAEKHLNAALKAKDAGGIDEVDILGVMQREFHATCLMVAKNNATRRSAFEKMLAKARLHALNSGEGVFYMRLDALRDVAEDQQTVEVEGVIETVDEDEDNE